jgi:hypothetical protein
MCLHTGFTVPSTQISAVVSSPFSGAVAAVVVSAAVRALPEPGSKHLGSALYSWFYRFSNGLMMNLDLAIHGRRPLSQYQNELCDLEALSRKLVELNSAPSTVKEPDETVRR